MKVSQLKTKTIVQASAAALDAAIATWVAAAGEAELIELQYMLDGANYTVLIVYTT